MSTRSAVAINLALVALFIGGAVYLYNGIDELTATFIDIRKSEAKFFSQLIQENWDGIRTVPDEKKKILVSNLDPQLAGTDLRILRSLLITTSLLLCSLAVLDRVNALFKLWRATRGPANAP